jgi:hypothetical protein
MNNLKEYIKKLEDSGASFREQEQALKQIEKTIKESKETKKDAIASKNADIIVAAFKKIENKLNKKYEELLNTPALAGAPGPQGPAGKDGKIGKDGLPGRDGRDGKDGKNGADGKDGISIIDAKIDFDGSLLIVLSDGNEIDAGRVVSDAVAKEYNAFMTRGEIIPTQTGNSGKYLTTDGDTLSWATVSGGASYPDQTGNNGKFLQTDGTDVSWQAVDALPSQTGNESKILSTDGTTAVWTQDFSKLNLMGY